MEFPSAANSSSVRCNARSPWKLVNVALCLILIAATGCQTSMTNPPSPAPKDATTSAEIPLHTGDTVRISFGGMPEAPAQQVRPDGKVMLPVGDYPVAGKTPSQVEKELLDRYGTNLVTKQITVRVESASYTVYINGQVLRPGPVKSNRPLTVLDAIMEAGGYDRTKANLEKVKVTRQESGRYRIYPVNVLKEMEGKAEPFMLKPGDVVDVPEKFVIFN